MGLRVGAAGLALARVNYRMMRLPLRVVEAAGHRVFDEPPFPLVWCERVLVECDRAAAALLDDQTLRGRAAATRLGIARRRRRERQEAVRFRGHRARFRRVRPVPGPPAPA